MCLLAGTPLSAPCETASAARRTYWIALSLTPAGEERLPIREPRSVLLLKRVRESFSFPTGKLDSRNNLRVVSAFNDIF